MTVYLVGHLDITDPVQFLDYQQAAFPIIKKWGGRILAAGPAAATLEGEDMPNHNVIIQFEHEGDAQSWYSDPEYQAAITLRLPHASTLSLSVLPGFKLS